MIDNVVSEGDNMRKEYIIIQIQKLNKINSMIEKLKQHKTFMFNVELSLFLLSEQKNIRTLLNKYYSELTFITTLSNTLSTTLSKKIKYNIE